MTIMILGDCHAAWQKLRRAIANGVSQHGVTAVIQVGDFGFFPGLFAQLEELLRDDPFPVPMHVIDGNHEDHAWLWKQAEVGQWERWASAYRLIAHRRGDTAVINGISVGFLGGALHADRSQHGSTSKETTNWITNRDVGRAIPAFTAAQVDLVVTHSCPHSIGIGMHGSINLLGMVERHIIAKGFSCGKIEDCGETALIQLWRQLTRQPKAWVFGHFHAHQQVMIGNTLFRCVGSSDGSDGREQPLGYILDPSTWTFSDVVL